MHRLLILLPVVFLATYSNAQVTHEVPEGKSIVYIMRPSALGLVINFSFYDGDQIIGKFNGRKYLRYECEPGRHIFWARSENRSFVEAELLEGKIYILEALPLPGATRAGVFLSAVDKEEEKLKRFQKLIHKKDTEVFSRQDLEVLSAEKEQVTVRGMRRLETLEEKGVELEELSPDMYVEPEDLVFVKGAKSQKAKKRKKSKKVT